MIHYFGGPINPMCSAIAVWTNRHAMVSFADRKQVALAFEIAASVALDNGAFSFWTRGQRPDWRRYRAWVQEWRTHPSFDWCIIPDVIDGTEKQNDRLVSEWHFPLSISVPVWHYHESIERLRVLAGAFPRVALGSSGEYRCPGSGRVYGIIHQNKGTIQVSSESGHGTVFELYFLAVREGEAATEPPADRLLKKEATETALLAEDEPAVRGLVRETLERLGYAVLEAKDGYEALRVIEESKATIHLLLTDVIMPLMNGRELATRLESIRPGTKVLFMSGYMDDEFHGIAQPERDFIQKPFTAADLAEKLREVLAADQRET